MNRLSKIVSGIGKAVAPLALIGLVSCGPNNYSVIRDFTVQSSSAAMELSQAIEASSGRELLIKTDKGFYHFATNKDNSPIKLRDLFLQGYIDADKNGDWDITNKEAREFFNSTYNNVAKSYLEAFLKENKLKSDSIIFDSKHFYK